MEIKKIGNYTVIHALSVGRKEIAVGEDDNAPYNERYMCCYVESNAIFERYTECVAGDSFAEIMKIFGERIAAASTETLTEIEKAEAEIKNNNELTQKDCTPALWEDSIEGKVVVIAGEALKREFRYASYQLMLCTGGFGAQAEAKGRTCYCTNLFDGKKSSFYRSDILGVIEPDKLPEWAKTRLEAIKNN